MNCKYYGVTEIMAIMGIGKSKAYQIIQDLNNEMKSDGYFTIAGKIPKTYADRRLFGYEENQNH